MVDNRGFNAISLIILFNRKFSWRSHRCSCLCYYQFSFHSFICRSCDQCWWVSSQLVLINCIIYPVFNHCWDYTWLGRECKCDLLASRTTCLHSCCDTRSLRWTCVHLSTRSFLIHATMLVAFVLSTTTSHLH